MKNNNKHHNAEFTSRINTNIPIPDMANLVIANENAKLIEDNNTENNNNNGSLPPIQVTNTSTNPLFPLPEPPKVSPNIIDETIPRQCDYLGSFEVRNFPTPEERGNYITQQLYVICKKQHEKQQSGSSLTGSFGKDTGCTKNEDYEEVESLKNDGGDDHGSEAKHHQKQASIEDPPTPGTSSNEGETSPNFTKSDDFHSQKQKSWPVCLMLTIAGIKVCDPKDLKQVLQMFALRRISFSTAIPALNVFAISAREPGSPTSMQYAHVFRTDQAEEINQIVGLAFKQAYTLEKPNGGQTLQQESPMNKIPFALQQQKQQQLQQQQMQQNKLNQIQQQQYIPPQLPTNPPIHKKQSFEQRIFSQLLTNTELKTNKLQHSSSQKIKDKDESKKSSGLGNLGLLRRSKSFKKGISLVSGSKGKDASREFSLGNNVETGIRHVYNQQAVHTTQPCVQSNPQHQPHQSQQLLGTISGHSLHSQHSSHISHQRSLSGLSNTSSNNGITYAYNNGLSANKIPNIDVSGYESNSLSSGSFIQNQNNNNLQTNLQNQQNTTNSLGKDSTKSAENDSNKNNPDFSRIAPQKAWHQPDLHPDTARDLLINMPLGSFFIVGSRSPLNLMIRGERNIWQFGVVITNKGYHLLLRVGF